MKAEGELNEGDAEALIHEVEVQLQSLYRSPLNLFSGNQSEIIDDSMGNLAHYDRKIRASLRESMRKTFKIGRSGQSVSTVESSGGSRSTQGGPPVVQSQEELSA